VRVVGNGAVEFAQRVETERIVSVVQGDKDGRSAGCDLQGEEDDVRGSSIEVRICVAAVEFNDAREVTDRALKLHATCGTNCGRHGHLNITWPSLSNEIPRL
jgi:hypothetical protein